MVTKSPSLVLLLPLLLVIQYCYSLSIGLTLKLVQTSETQEFSRNTHIIPKNYMYPNYIIRPHMTHFGFKVLIEASIGTPPAKKTFIFDTGSPITWTQCTPCIKCFPQIPPLFDPKKSASYKKMPPNHNLSHFFDISSDGVGFELDYHSGQSASGIMSLETFTFPSHTGSHETLKNIVFGCANDNVGEWPEKTPITGIMGMDRSSLSLLGQMGLKSVKRFSYCVPKLSSPTKTTFLRLGSDVKTRTGLQCSKLLGNTFKYVVGLEGVSVMGRRLKVPKGTFSGGCQFDTGAASSRVDSRAFKLIADIVSQHFDKFKLTRVTGPMYEDQMCYKKKPGFNSFPNMTFHLKASGLCSKANVQISGENLFGHEGDMFCMMMYGLEKRSILGAFQMQNMRFVYDLVGGKVLFGAEDCSKDKP